MHVPDQPAVLADLVRRRISAKDGPECSAQRGIDHAVPMVYRVLCLLQQKLVQHINL